MYTSQGLVGRELSALQISKYPEPSRIALPKLWLAYAYQALRL